MELVAEKYKQTDIGLIPIDWDVKKFIDVTKIITCGLAATPKYVDESIGKPFLSAQNVQEGKVVYDKYRFIPKKLFEQITKNNPPEKGDLLYTRVGAGIGEAGVIETDLKFGIYVSLTLIRTDEKKLHNYYLLFLLNSPKFRFLAKNGQFAGGGVQNLNVQIVRDFLIPLPSISEQTLIATALSDADALISSLEKLIEKKRNIKQGAMQQLLKPKKGWEEKKIKEIFQFRQGIQCSIDNQKSDDKEGLQRFIRIIDLTQASEPARYIDDPGTSYHVDIDDLFMVRYGNPGLLGYGFKGVIANNLFRLIPKIKMSNKYFYYLLSYKNEDILQLTSSTTMAALNFTSLNSLKLCFPLSIDEQKNIVSILNDMDNEITSLEKKLSKSKMLKQGMMQELLTGKIRLV